MFLLIVGFVVGVFVGYKYPQQVDQVVESSKKVYRDLKEKLTKSTPQGPSGQ